MSMRELLAGGEASSGYDRFIPRLYEMTAGEVQKFLSVERNRALFFAAISEPFPLADLITHPDFATKICASSAAMSVVSNSSAAMSGMLNSQVARAALWGSSSALNAIQNASPAVLDVIQSDRRTRLMSGNAGMLQSTFISGKSMTLRVRTVNAGDSYGLKTLAGGSGTGIDILDLFYYNWHTRVRAYRDLHVYQSKTNGFFEAYVVDMN